MKKYLLSLLILFSLNSLADSKSDLEKYLNDYNASNNSLELKNNLNNLIAKNKEDESVNSAKILLASINRNENNYNEAIKNLESVINSKISNNNQKIQSNLLLYNMSVENNDVNNILQSIDNLSKLDNNNLEYKALQLAERVIAQNGFTNYYKNIRNNYNNNEKEKIYYYVAYTLAERGVLDKSKVYLNLLTQLKTKNVNEYSKYINSIIAEKENNIDTSLKYALEVYNINNKNVYNIARIAQIYAKKNDLENSLKYLVILNDLLNNSNYDLLKTLSDLYYQKNDYNNTLKYLIYQNNIKSDLDTIANMIIISLKDSNDEVANIIYSNLTKDKEVNFINYIDIYIATKAINLEKYEVAKLFADRLLNRNENVAHYFLTIIYFNNNNIEKAKEELKLMKEKNVSGYEELNNIINK